MKWREKNSRHDDAHIPLGGKGKRSISRKSKLPFKCGHPMITTGVIDRCSVCGEEIPKKTAPVAGEG